MADTSASAPQTGTGPIPRIGAAASAKPFRNEGTTKHIFVTGGVVSSLGKVHRLTCYACQAYSTPAIY